MAFLPSADRVLWRLKVELPRASVQELARQKELSGDHSPIDARALLRDLATYREPDPARSMFELAVTVVPFVTTWIGIWLALDHGFWVGLFLTLPAAGLLVRLFVIQHDCGHGSFFRSRRNNDWLGRVLGVLTLTPFDCWRCSHAHHHANSGNLAHRGIGDIDTLTVEEYRARATWRRFQYRLYRHPIVMFGVGPAYMFVFRHRLPLGAIRSDRRAWASVMGTNAGIALIVTAVVWLVGVGPFLIIQIPITLMASTLGVWLFYVQHQFEATCWDDDAEWSFHKASLHGSSHYQLPRLLRWFTGNIGVHHVHHLSSTIPFYRLCEVLRDRPELAKLGRLTVMQSFKSVPLVLWDRRQRRLISFRELAKSG